MCKPSGGIESIKGPYRMNISSYKGNSNTRTDYYDEQTGELLQQRWYGPDGRAIIDRDWNHKDTYNTHKFPHDHYWDYTKKIPRQDGVNEINNDYC